MTIPDRCRDVRLNLRFPVELCKDGLNLWFEGMSTNLSQVGAFIKTKNWQCFKVNDHAGITCLLPPDFTGQSKTISLQGEARIKRIEPQNQGVAVEFVKSFKQFEPIVEYSPSMGRRT